MQTVVRLYLVILYVFQHCTTPPNLCSFVLIFQLGSEVFNNISFITICSWKIFIFKGLGDDYAGRFTVSCSYLFVLPEISNSIGWYEPSEPLYTFPTNEIIYFFIAYILNDACVTILLSNHWNICYAKK